MDAGLRRHDDSPAPRHSGDDPHPAPSFRRRPESMNTAARRLEYPCPWMPASAGMTTRTRPVIAATTRTRPAIPATTRTRPAIPATTRTRPVIPAKAGIHEHRRSTARRSVSMDAGLRRHDGCAPPAASVIRAFAGKTSQSDRRSRACAASSTSWRRICATGASSFTIPTDWPAITEPVSTSPSITARLSAPAQ